MVRGRGGSLVRGDGGRHSARLVTRGRLRWTKNSKPGGQIKIILKINPAKIVRNLALRRGGCRLCSSMVDLGFAGLKFYTPLLWIYVRSHLVSSPFAQNQSSRWRNMWVLRLRLLLRMRRRQSRIVRRMLKLILMERRLRRRKRRLTKRAPTIQSIVILARCG